MVRLQWGILHTLSCYSHGCAQRTPPEVDIQATRSDKWGMLQVAESLNEEAHNECAMQHRCL